MYTPPHRNATAPARAHLQIASAARQFHPLQCIAPRIWAGESVQTRQPRATEKPEILYTNGTNYAGLPTRFSAAKSDYFSLRSAPSFRDAAPQASLKSLTKNGTDFGARIQHPDNQKMAPFLVPESGHENLARFWNCICLNILRGNFSECLRRDFGTENGANFLLYGCWILAPKSVPFF